LRREGRREGGRGRGWEGGREGGRGREREGEGGSKWVFIDNMQM